MGVSIDQSRQQSDITQVANSIACLTTISNVVWICLVERLDPTMLYRDDGIRNGIRNTLGDPTWGENVKGIPGGRDVGKQYVDTYYAQKSTSGSFSGCNSYEDFRELIAEEKDLDVVKIMTPDHTHAVACLDALQRGKHLYCEKPLAHSIYEIRQLMKAARLADRPPSIPWALLRPNSRTGSDPAALAIRFALVAIRL